MTDAAFVKTVRYTSLLCCAILSGVAVTVLFLELALRQLTGPAYIRVRQVEFGFFTWYIGAVTVPTLVAVVMLVLHARRAHSAVLRPSVVALVLLLLALLVTLVVNGPVNVQESGWNALTPPADWARVRAEPAPLRRHRAEPASPAAERAREDPLRGRSDSHPRSASMISGQAVRPNRASASGVPP
ncbi:anthrone oxygenase family protein [Streptomyces sp. NPDC004532]